MPASKSKVPTEHAEQKGLLTWAALASINQPKLRLLFAIPNGGARSKATAGKLKAEGVKPGVPDLCLPVARGGFFGLWLEMKRIKGGTLSPEQIQWHQHLVAEGYYVITCKGQTEAEEALTAYLALPATSRTDSASICTDSASICSIPQQSKSKPTKKPTTPSKARVTDYTRKPKLQWGNVKAMASADEKTTPKETTL